MSAAAWGGEVHLTRFCLSLCRNYVRDWLRSVVELTPGLTLWLVGHAAAQLGHFEAQTAAAVQERSACDGTWTQTEALLHGLTALTKPILR
jgi:hypothetical protein